MESKALPKISVIIGVLNMQRFLGAAIDSVLKQNYPLVELIVMDGLSTDGTIDVIKQYEKNITYWISQKDKGHSDACNKAIDIATGDFIFLLNADDELGDNLFHKVAKVYQAHPLAKMITCGVEILEKDSNHKDHIIQRINDPEKLQISLYNILFELPVINARFFHKSIFTQFGKFQSTHPDGSYNLSNDRDFLIKLALAGVTSEIISEPLYFYLSHDDSLTFGSKNQIKSRKEHLWLAEKFLKVASLTSGQKYLLQTWQAKESAYLFLIYGIKGKIKDSLSLLKYGLCKGHFIWVKQLFLIVKKGITHKIKKTAPTSYAELPKT
jgi:glycosyltransferase involved in cell wall biosynthesis